MTQRVPKSFVTNLRASYDRLISAGVIAAYAIDETTGTGHVSFSPHALRLLQSGRRFASEPVFLEVMAAGDPDAVRAWLAAEVAGLDD